MIRVVPALRSRWLPAVTLAAWTGLSLVVSGPAPAVELQLPLRVSDNRRHLADQRGTPFFYHADTAWMLFTKLTEQEAAEYIGARRSQGFNAIQVQLTGFLGNRNRAGDLPFAGTPPEQDFSRPNERFYAHVDRVVEEAAAQGMILAIAPLWSGCCGEGWAGRDEAGGLKPLNANGPDKCRALGRWLGDRYGKHPHIVWILGGDNDPDNARDEIRALGEGLKQTAPQQLVTYHAASSHSSTDVWPADESWLDLVMVYTYFRGFDKAWRKDQPDVYEVSLAEFAKTPVRPFFLGESTYEGEHGAWGSELQARKNAYWCLLSGGCGHAYGSPNWNFPANWRETMHLPGAVSLRHLAEFVAVRPWWKIEPDAANRIAVGGRGEFASNDATITGIADDRSFSWCYLPRERAVTIDLAALAGEQLTAAWFNPRTGDLGTAETFVAKRPTAFSPPASGDWLLVLESR
jgi:hypothetical protein